MNGSLPPGDSVGFYRRIVSEENTVTIPSGDANPEAANPEADGPEADRRSRKARWKRRRRVAGFLLLLVASALLIGRAYLPQTITWYVNRTIDRSPLYDGRIGDIEVHLWRGAYTINDIRLNKKTGNVPVPLFAAKSVDLAIEWKALREGKLVGVVAIDKPELNFVDAGKDSDNQTGAGGPWLGMVRDLFPFKINSVTVSNGSAHFRAPAATPPVDVYISDLNATVSNISNIRDEVTPLISTVSATGTAMDQAKFELEVKFDPFSYRPTFQLATRLLGLDVAKLNDLTRAYGSFDFEAGYFDLVVELDAKEGQVEGYVKPLFRNLKVLNLSKDLNEDNPLQVFWEALVGGTTRLFRNTPRDQFGTNIPISGDFTAPDTDLLATIGNILHNAFVRAYLPKLDRTVTTYDSIRFAPGRITDPGAAADGR